MLVWQTCCGACTCCICHLTLVCSNARGKLQGNVTSACMFHQAVLNLLAVVLATQVQHAPCSHNKLWFRTVAIAMSCQGHCGVASDVFSGRHCLEGKDGQNCHCTHLAYVGTPLLTVDINSVQDCPRDRSCILISASRNKTLCAPVICFNLCLGKVMRVPTSAATFLVASQLMLVGLG